MRGKIVLSLLAVGMFAMVANAAILSWDFDTHPTQQAVDPMSGAWANGADWTPANTTDTPYGDDAGGQLNGDGTATFADGTGESSNSGFFTGGIGNQYTLEVRVKVLEDVVQTAGKSFTIRNNVNQRGVKLRPGGIELVSGTSVVGSGSVDLATDYQIIRITVQEANTGGNQATVKVWDPGDGIWMQVVAGTNMGGSGGGDPTPFPGIGLGSLAGSSTQSGKYLIDYARVDVDRLRPDSEGPMIPEPATLLLLVLGAPLLRRRG